MGVPAALDVAAEIAGVKEDVAAARHLRHQQAAPMPRREMRHHLIEPGGYAGTIAPVAALGRLHDPGGWETGAAQDPLGALVAFVLAAEDRALHGAIMAGLDPPVHRTMVRVLWTGCASIPDQSSGCFLRQNSIAVSARDGPTRSGEAPSATRRTGSPSALSHGSAPCQTILFSMA